eukprot:c45706_g1_i1 orf=102-335(+)
MMLQRWVKYCQGFMSSLLSRIGHYCHPILSSRVSILGLSGFFLSSLYYGFRVKQILLANLAECRTLSNFSTEKPFSA